jgi:hypothetical protein
MEFVGAAALIVLGVWLTRPAEPEVEVNPAIARWHAAHCNICVRTAPDTPSPDTAG